MIAELRDIIQLFVNVDERACASGRRTGCLLPRVGRKWSQLEAPPTPDRCDDRDLSRSRMLDACGRFVLSRRH